MPFLTYISFLDVFDLPMDFCWEAQKPKHTQAGYQCEAAQNNLHAESASRSVTRSVKLERLNVPSGRCCLSNWAWLFTMKAKARDPSIITLSSFFFFFFFSFFFESAFSLYY
jgi:hypothetical protein